MPGNTEAKNLICGIDYACNNESASMGNALDSGDAPVQFFLDELSLFDKMAAFRNRYWHIRSFGMD